MFRLARYALVLALVLGTLVPPGARACPIAPALASAVAAESGDCGPGCDEACPEPGDEGCTDCDDGCATCPCCAIPAGAVPLGAAFAGPSPAADRLLADRFASRGARHAAGPFQPPRA